jgi:sugar phosphate isomerase/epimerase
MTKQCIGLQLYTIRDETTRDFRGTLRQVAEMGYQAVEFAGYGGTPPKEMATLLTDLGLRAIGSHVGLSLLEQDLEREIEYCLEIGCPYITIPTLTLQWRSSNATGYRRLAAHLQKIAFVCKKRGISLVYHNHDFDFQQSEGQYLLDILLEETDPTLLQLELDTGWFATVGIDPVAYLRKYTDRTPFIHLKDITAESTFAEVGEGILDIATYCKAAIESGTQFYIVENDTPRHPSLESVRRSLNNLNRIFAGIDYSHVVKESRSTEAVRAIGLSHLKRVHRSRPSRETQNFCKPL